MKKCQGTYNYIFSNHSLAFLQELRLLQQQSSTKEANGYIAKDIWLKNSSNFCIQFREIINEEEFLTGAARSLSIESIEPGFIDNQNMPDPEDNQLESIYTLKGLLIEDSVAARKQVLEWEFPCQIYWFLPQAGTLFHQFSYKKKFSFWAILIECKNMQNLSQINTTNVTEVEFQNKKALWVHLETTSWDFLIFTD